MQKFIVGDEVIVKKNSSTFYKDMGKVIDIRFNLDISDYLYYVNLYIKDNGPYMFTEDELETLISAFFSQKTIDILS